LPEKILDYAPVDFFTGGKKTTGSVSLQQVLLLEKIFNFAPMEKKTTGAVSLEQVLLPEKILDYAPVDFF